MDPFASWPGGRRIAVSLTYDDALPVHFEKVAPELEKRGFRGTFYVPANVAFLRAVASWREVAARGHELGNHSVFHPCRKPNRGEKSWLDDAYDLKIYSEKRLVDELDLANAILQTVDGKTRRSYGNTCHEVRVGEGEAEFSLVPLMRPRFVAARGRCLGRPVDPRGPDLSDLGCLRGDGRAADEILAELDRSRGTFGWSIYCFHGIGQGTHGLFTDTAEHLRLLDGLVRLGDEAWVAPVAEIATFLSERSSVT